LSGASGRPAVLLSVHSLPRDVSGIIVVLFFVEFADVLGVRADGLVVGDGLTAGVEGVAAVGVDVIFFFVFAEGRA
jgi:hypothetical protein